MWPALSSGDRPDKAGESKPVTIASACSHVAGDLYIVAEMVVDVSKGIIEMGRV